MKDLNYQLSKLCRDNRDGGFSTQATRSRILDLIASQLQELLSAVAVFAAGGHKALQNFSKKAGREVLLITQQLSKR